MLGASRIMTFVPTQNPALARAFYEGALGLRFVREGHFALVFDAGGIMLRVTTVPELRPARFTILGWEVPDIGEAVSALQERGVVFEKYGLPDQDELGIWRSPTGARIAWFKDPDGNVLSVTQFP
jgi:catechol 2,3-dioxygenase-like lactoylglutathione lyase family enzyme